MIKLTLVLFLVSVACTVAKGPDAKRNVTQLIESRGFKAETHTVTTSDGYILNMFRIVHPNLKGTLKQPIILQHGLAGNADYWLINELGHLDLNNEYVEETGVVTDCSAVNPDKVGNTIGFVLAYCGYDVWLGNNRGTKYSTGHTKYNLLKDSDYWKYSVDDLSTDAAAMIDMVLKETKSDHVGWMGHSMGTTQMFQLLSEKADYNKVVKPFIAVAPVAYLAHIEGLLKFASVYEKIPFVEDINAPFLFFPENDVKYVGSLLTNVCSLPIVDGVCEELWFLIMGINPNDNDAKKIAEDFGHLPDDTSFKVVTQMAHRVSSNTFAKFDYKLGNLMHYGSLSPPKYDLTKITNPNMIFMSGQNDLLADPRDVDKMRNELKVKLYEDYIVPDKNWNHLDFMVATNAGKMVTSKILNVLAKFN